MVKAFKRRCMLPAWLAVCLGAALAPQTTAPAPRPISTTVSSDANRKAHAQWYAECEQRVAAMKGGPCDIIFIGDSITENFVHDPTPAWDEVGKAVWDKHYAGRNALDFGVGADRTQDVLWRLENMDIKGFDPKVAVVMIGTNNNTNTPEEIAAGVKAVLARTQATFAHARIILVSILPNARAAQRMEDANKLIQPLADEKKIFYFDLAAKMVKQGDTWKGLGKDKLHLASEGYELWASEMEPLLSKLLEAVPVKVHAITAIVRGLNKAIGVGMAKPVALNVHPLACKQRSAMRLRHTIVSILTALAVTSPAFGASDGIFPASTPEAAKAIHWSDNGYFVINGQPTFISSGEIHYARVPRELWKDRILRAKAMGFNTIQTYVMWNAHEGTEGHFDFSGNLDLDAWLSLVQECGMYADVRPGPYVCAEWENGGLPAWLCDKPDMKVRVNDPQYLSYVDKFESKVFDIIAKHQIHKGGNVLMVQLENEYPNTWGTDTNPYLTHLYNLARQHGLEIPLFDSGLHHGDDPAGNRPFGNRTTPWFTTEFWTGWIGLEGDMNAQKAEEKIRGTWKIIGFGGAGYDYYVVHGGSDFGYSKGAEVTASYDYAAPIGEAGELRKAYFPMKRAAMFAQAYADLFTSSKDGGNLVASTTANLQTYARTSPDGAAIFLADAARYQGGNGGGRGRGRGGQAGAGLQNIQTQIKLADGRQIPSGNKTLTLTPGEIRPILIHTYLNPEPRTIQQPVMLDYAATGILTRQQLGINVYIVCYGAPGDAGEVKVAGQAQPITFIYPKDDQVLEVPLNAGNGTLLVMNTDLAERTWLVGKDQARMLVIGPHYASAEGGIETPTTGSRVICYSAAGRKEIAAPPHDALNGMPKLNWSEREGSLEASPATDDSQWAASAEPKPMEQYDDYPNGWGWYRTTIHRDAAGEIALRFTGAGDVLRLFVNGQRVAGDKTGATLALKAGDNELAVLCWNEGRPKMYNFTGPTGLMAAKGIWGPVMVIDKTLASITNWRLLNTNAATAADNGPAAPDFNDANWPQVRIGGNTMNSRVGYAWFRAAFDVPAGTTQAMLLHQGVDDEGEFFLNGQSVGRHIGWNIGGSVDISKALRPGRNVLAIRVKNNDGSGGMAAAVDIVAMKGAQQGWHFHPGLSNMQETPLLASVTNWREFLDGKGLAGWMSQPDRPIAPNTPLFFRADFSLALDPQIHQPVGLRTAGLKSGSVWINGHNIGPYKNTGNAVTEMYVPECWLNNGSNTLVIFDAEGASPAQAALHPLETWATMQLPK